MQKKLIFISILLFSCLVYLSEHKNTKASIKEPFSTEHNILLDLTSKNDQVIFDNLLYSNYDCSTLNSHQALCRQFQTSSEVISSDGQAIKFYSIKTKKGDDLKVYTLANGEAHIEFRLESTKTLHRYSFTSIKKIPLFKNEKEFITSGPFKDGMSSLIKIL